jgi:hypothetical protein
MEAMETMEAAVTARTVMATTMGGIGIHTGLGTIAITGVHTGTRIGITIAGGAAIVGDTKSLSVIRR